MVSIVCACAEYPTIRGVADLYVNSPCNFPLYFTHTLVFPPPTNRGYFIVCDQSIVEVANYVNTMAPLTEYGYLYSYTCT